MTTAVMHESPRPSDDFSDDDATAGRLLLGLLRSLAAEAVTDELYDDLETVLGEYAVPASPAEGAAIANRLRQTATKLTYVVPRLIKSYPMAQQRLAIDQLRTAINLSNQHPAPENSHGHLVRFASSLLTLLDHLGDAAA
ncbi:DUF6415 family natural product biosynthesis protein [Streptomyces sp. NPDC091292]|uniref:DUF6415 family natural product biosynthesis protein n=1 Tax=Streptomyces sp. NPDC091292 TaxID=3365991 RepID=UPI003804B24C